MDTSLLISIVICTYNRADYIFDALESLRNQTISKEVFEVIIVNNNSSDNTEIICKNYIQKYADYQFYYLNEPLQGSSFARNTGASIAKSPLLCFMDDDAVANTDYLEKIVLFFETHSTAGGLGGRIVPKYIPAEPKWMSHFVSSLVGNFNYNKQVVAFAANKYPLESNMVVKKVDFDTIKGFNTALPGVKGTLRIGGEGKDFFLRLKALGRTIFYDPSVIVQHVVETAKLTREYMYRVASGIGRGERVRMLEKNKWALYKKLIEYIFKLGGAFVLSAFYLLQIKPAKALPVIYFRWDALKGLMNY